jgi:small subunit ribosomal protein S1
VVVKKSAKESKKSSSKTVVKRVSPQVPQTMAELLTQIKKPLKAWKRGDLVEGVVTEKSSRAIYLDIGGKTEGMVIDREMKAARDYIKDLEIGDKVMAIITQAENDKGYPLMSLKKAASERIWAEFEEKLKTREIVNVRGREVNRGGLVVEIRGTQGFIPSSQFAAQYQGKIEELVGVDLSVKVIEVDGKKSRLIFSEREVSEAGLLKEQEKILKKIKAGQELAGVVTGIMPFGLFVKVTLPKGEIAIEGLVHISEISWEKVDDPSKYYKQKDKVKVRVLAVDNNTGKLNLSIKQLLEDPWDKIEGVVTRLAPFGAFVSLVPGVEGLIHISKIPTEKSINPGDKVDCYVESVDKEHRRMSLGLVLTAKPVGYK